MTSRPWWRCLGPGDEQAPVELAVECCACAGMGTDEDGADCPCCDGSGETSGEDEIDGRRECSDIDAWHARMDALDRECKALR